MFLRWWFKMSGSPINKPNQWQDPSHISVEIQTPESKFSGTPTWIESKRKNKVLNLSFRISKGITIFPLNISINGKIESVRLIGRQARISLNDFIVFINYKNNKEDIILNCYFFYNNYQKKATPKPRLELVEEFKNLHSPFVGKYRKGIESSGLFGTVTDWIQVEKRLSDQLILKARSGEAKLGYFSTHSPDIVGIDLDFHDRSNPWGKYGLIKTLESYENLITSIRLFPSFVYRSPRGMHLFFKFNSKAPWELLRDRIKEGLESFNLDIHAEILPTPNSSLRIDPITNYLDPKTLEPIPPPNLKDIKTYTLVEFFGYDLGDWNKPKQKKERSITLRKITTLESLEQSILPITKSNQIFRDCPLLPAYFKSGLTVIQAAERVVVLLKSSSYSGELLSSPKRLLDRIESAWRNFKRKGYSFEGNTKERQLELRDSTFINSIVSNSPFSRTRSKSFFMFMENLLGWIRYQQNLTHEEKAWFSYFYTYRENRKISGYRVFSQRGWIPIPSEMLWKWDRRYKDFLDWLILQKVLKIETGYSVEKKQCRYFSFKELIEVKSDPEQLFIECLENTNLTQSELGKLLGVPQYEISRLFQNKLSRLKVQALIGKWEGIQSDRRAEFANLKGYAKNEKHI